MTTTQSNGDVVRKEIYYPIDYTMPGILQTMVSNNIISTPVATYTSLQKEGSIAYEYLGAEITDYTLSNGDIKAGRKLAGRASQPVTGFSFDASNEFNYPALTEVGAFTYDGNGNLVGLKDEGARQLANIYDYDQKFIVASVINADPVLDKPCYSGFETDALGGWALSNGDEVFDNNSIAGKRSLVLAGYSVGAGQLNPQKTYKLTFWAMGAIAIAANSVTLVTSGPSLNGFTYYEYEVAGGPPVSVASADPASPAKIDELRLYPKNARMRTVSYDALIGKTSECDENNRITYYEYDAMGRMRFVKDEKGNVKKMLEYNTKQ